MAIRYLAVKMKTPARLCPVLPQIDMLGWRAIANLENPFRCPAPALSVICDTVSDLRDGVAKHLRKTQINKLRAARDKELHLSQLIFPDTRSRLLRPGFGVWRPLKLSHLV